MFVKAMFKLDFKCGKVTSNTLLFNNFQRFKGAMNVPLLKRSKYHLRLHLVCAVHIPVSSPEVASVV
jgi:hypothetical protein